MALPFKVATHLFLDLYHASKFDDEMARVALDNLYLEWNSVYRKTPLATCLHRLHSTALISYLIWKMETTVDCLVKGC